VGAAVVRARAKTDIRKVVLMCILLAVVDSFASL
jgi:hypothetical protein